MHGALVMYLDKVEDEIFGNTEQVGDQGNFLLHFQRILLIADLTQVTDLKRKGEIMKL